MRAATALLCSLLAATTIGRAAEPVIERIGRADR